MGEADVAVIADLLPEDVEMDPAQHAYEFGDSRLSRGIQSHQFYWRAYGTWCPRAWRVGFVVRSRSGEILGVQELEGNDFLALRTVDSSSFLLPAVRGGGCRQPVRTPVLAPGFRALGAPAALTSAGCAHHPSPWR